MKAISKILLSSLLLCFILLTLGAQIEPETLIQDMNWRNIGPANQGGRIVDIEAVENDFRKVYIATASGGVWKSDNAGTSWKSIFDHYSTASIGDIAISQNNPELIWVGTGESNNRNSVSWGDGVFKSMDGGETFTNMGLNTTHHISRVVIHPKREGTVYVASMGHLWGYSGDRGLFMTKDGGENWEKLNKGLPADSKIGCTDLLQDPKNPNILYAAFYHRLRQPWHFHSGGDKGGIFKSTNGGKSWKKLEQGLPAGPTGRIGLAIYKKNPKILIALIEAEKSDTLSIPGSGLYRSEDGGKNWKYVNTYNNRPFYYSQVRINPHDDQKIYLLTTRFMVSDDGGKTLRNGSQDQEVHGDFHAMWLDPNHPDRYYLGADKGISITHDHGKHFTLLDNLAIGQFYRINPDMRDPYYVYGGLQDNGTYGTASFSRDIRGILNDSNWKLHWGDGQFINIHPDNWRKVYTETENGSVMTYDPLTHRISSIRPNAGNIVNYTDYIPDSLRYTTKDIRYNWTAPFQMSPHDPQTLYLAGNHVLMTTDEGNQWKIISPDLSTNDPNKKVRGRSGGITPDNSGAEQHCAIYTLALSPIDPFVIWAGTDDGQVHVTTNGGSTWLNVRENIPGVPDGLWVSRIEASHFDAGKAYIVFDGHRSDDFNPWVFVSSDFGENWRDLKSNISENTVIRVIREDLINQNLLFLGTETGILASIDQGNNWFPFMNKLPTVSVYDLKIHPRDHDLIAGTHGRSLWIADDISPLQQLTDDVLESDFHLFDQRRATLWENVSRGGQRGHFLFAGDNPETIEPTSSLPRARFKNNAMITYFMGEKLEGDLTLSISDIAGIKVHEVILKNNPGIQRYKWNLDYDVSWLTQDQSDQVNAIFSKLLDQFTFPQLQRAYDRFKNAKTPRAQRASISILSEDFFDTELEDSYFLNSAAPGTYILTLGNKNKTLTKNFQIRADPLLK